MYRIINRNKLAVTMAADLIGGVLTAPWRLFRRFESIESERIQSVLVIRTAYIGDVVMATALLGPLRRRFPEAKIAFVTAPSAAPVLENNPYCDEIIPFAPFWFYPKASRAGWPAFVRAMRQRRFDLVIEARGDVRDILGLVAPLRATFKVGYAVGGGGFLLTHAVPHPRINHRVPYHLDIARFLGADLEAAPLEWGLRLTPPEIEEAAKIVARAGAAKGYWCAHPGSRVPLKRWSADKYVAALDLIGQDLDLPLVLVGAGDETAFIAEIADRLRRRPINLTGALSLRQLAGVLGQSALFACNDSAPMHVAASQGVPCAALFGPSKSAETGPYNAFSRTAEVAMACRAACDETTCRHPEFHACMERLAPEDLRRAAAEALAAKKGPR